MSCIYTYKGIEYTSKEALEKAVTTDIINGELQPVTSTNKMVYEVNGFVGESAAISQAVENYGNSDFISFVDVDNKKYMIIDEKLVEQQISPERILFNSLGQPVTVDMDKEFEKFLQGKSTRMFPALYDELQLMLAQKIKDISREKALQHTEEIAIDLKQTLLNFTSGLGISITTLEDYQRNYEKRFGAPQTVQGLADMLNNVIAVADTNDLTTLTEEASHFAIEYYKDQELIKKMMEKVSSTRFYQQWAEQYRAAYKDQLQGEALENKVRKEILGKILAEKVKENFDTSNEALNAVGIIQNLKNLLDKFLQLFKKNDQNKEFFREFGKSLDMIVSDMQSPLTNFAPYESQEYYFSLSEQEKSLIKDLNKLKSNLANKYKLLSKQGLKSKTAELEQIAQDIQNTEYGQAMSGALTILKNDLDQFSASIRAAENTTNRDIQQERLADPDYQELTNDEREEKFAINFGDVNIMNLILFSENIDNTLAQLEGNIDYLETELGENGRRMAAGLRSKLSSVRKVKDQVAPKIRSISRFKLLRTMKEVMKEVGMSQKVIDAQVAVFLQNKMEDIGWLTTQLMGYGTYGNPITTFIYNSTRMAGTKANMRRRNFLTRLKKLTKELNLSEEQTKDLIDDRYFIDEIHWGAADDAFEEEKAAFEKEYLEKLEKAKTEEEKNKVIVERDEAYDKLRDKWFVSKFNNNFRERLTSRTTPNPITGSTRRSKIAQRIIQDEAAQRRKIYDTYRDENGNVDTTAFSSADRIRLQSLKSDRARSLSFYDDNGRKKGDYELSVVYDLQDYYESGDLTLSEKALQLFEVSREHAKRTLSAEKFLKWEEANTYERYSEEVLPQDSIARLVDEEETELSLSDIQKIELASSVVIEGEFTYQKAYDALKKKQNQLLAPYKKLNKGSEIDGEAVENNPDLLQTLEHIQSQLQWFTLETSSEYKFVSHPNEAFQNKFNKLKQTPELLSDWLRVNAKLKSGTTGRNASDYTPRYRHYTKYEMVDDAGNIIPRERVPSFSWELKVQDKQEINPEYRPELEGRAPQYRQEIRDKYRNEKFFQLFNPDSQGIPTTNKDLWSLRKFMLNEKEAMDKGITGMYNSYFLLPQVRPSDQERLLSPLDKGYSVIRDKITINNYDDDFNVDDLQDGSEKYIPRYYTYKAKKGEILSDDLAFMMEEYAQMAFNYNEKSKVLMELTLFKEALAASNFKDKGQGVATQLYKATEEFMDMAVYGNKYKQTLPNFEIGGNTYSMTKTVNVVESLIRSNNLGLSIFVPLTGFLSGTVLRRLSASEKTYISKTSLAVANTEMELGLQAIKSLEDVGAGIKNNKINKILEFSGVGSMLGEESKGLFASNRIKRALLKANPLFDLVGYGVFSRISAATTTLAVYDNFRLYEGQFISLRNFENRFPELSEKQVLEKWSELKDRTYYNFLVEQDSFFELDKTKLKKYGFTGDVNDLQARMEINAQTMHEIAEGQVGEEDKALSNRNVLAKLALWMHRGYFQRFLESRFKARQANIPAGVEEKGTYRSVGTAFKQGLLGLSFLDQMIFLSGLFKQTDAFLAVMDKLGLDNVDKTNMKRIRKDMRAYAAAFAVFVLTSLFADDDENKDDFITQYIAYISARVFMETASVQFPFGLPETLKMFNSPSAGINFFDNLVGIPGVIINSQDVVQSGTYEGMTKRMKGIIKSTALKNVFEPYYGDMYKSRNYFRLNAIPAFPNKIIKLLDEIEEE